MVAFKSSRGPGSPRAYDSLAQGTVCTTAYRRIARTSSGRALGAGEERAQGRGGRAVERPGAGERRGADRHVGRAPRTAPVRRNRASSSHP